VINAHHNVPTEANPAGTQDDPGGHSREDLEATAREAISHLSYHDLVFRWDLPGEPSEAVKRLVASYFQDGEIVSTLSHLACRYVMKALADDHLGISGIEIPEEAHEPDENPSAQE
jgi:hypothetical protein